MIEKYHDRTLSRHPKDWTADNDQVAWGQSKARLTEILRLMQMGRWTFPAEIELEYEIPKGSNALKEVTRCVQ